MKSQLSLSKITVETTQFISPPRWDVLTPKKFKDNFGKKVGADEESRKNQMVCSVKTWSRVMQARSRAP